MQAFVVAAVKVAESHCLLLKELSHTDLIDQPAFLLCLVDHIARLAVSDQKKGEEGSCIRIFCATVIWLALA